jgi:hypothetical protein
MESNGFSKSQNIPPTVNLLLSVSNTSFISLNEAFSVEELLLKPYCWVANILFWLMCWYNLLYITFSRIFEKDVSKEIGLKLVIPVLSLFFYVSALFQKILNGREKYLMKVVLHMYVKGDVMKGVLTFRNFIRIPSHA